MSKHRKWDWNSDICLLWNPQFVLTPDFQQIEWAYTFRFLYCGCFFFFNGMFVYICVYLMLTCLECSVVNGMSKNLLFHVIIIHFPMNVVIIFLSFYSHLICYILNSNKCIHICSTITFWHWPHVFYRLVTRYFPGFALSKKISEQLLFHINVFFYYFINFYKMDFIFLWIFNFIALWLENRTHNISGIWTLLRFSLYLDMLFLYYFLST